MFNKMKGEIKDKIKDAGNNLMGATGNKLTQAKRKVSLYIKRVTHFVKGFIKGLIATLTNPIFYISIGFFALCVVVYSGSKVFLKENFETDCGELAAPVFSTGSENSEKRDKLIMGHFLNTGMSKKQASVVSAYIMSQTEGDPSYGVGNKSSYDNQKIINSTPFKMGLTGNINSVDLAKWADKNSADWRSSDTQLRYLSEFYGKNNEALQKSGFTKKENASSFLKGIGESSVDSSSMDKLAKDIAKDYSKEGEECKAIGDGSGNNIWAPLSGSGKRKNTAGLDATEITKLAWSYAVEYGAGTNRVGGVTNAGSSSKPELIEAYEATYDKYGRDPLAPASAIYSKDCGRNVAIAMKLSGRDPNYPYGNVEAQKDYMLQRSNEYSIIDCNSREPGDILIYTDGTSIGSNASHTELYVGDPDGTGEEWTVESSYQDYEPERKPFKYKLRTCNSSGGGTDYLGRTVYWFRKAG